VYRKSHADFHDTRGLDDVQPIDGPREAVVHAGTDVGVDGTEPAHHCALVSAHDIESRGQINCKKKDKDAKKPAIAKAETR
jgi:hypothetical protein